MIASFGQSHPEGFKERTLGNVITSEMRVEYPFTPQEGHVPDLVQGQDQLIKHQSFCLRPEEQIPHLMLIDPNSLHQWLTNAELQVLSYLIHAFVDHPVNMRSTAQRISILHHAHRRLLYLLSKQKYIRI